jgi:flagellar motor switch/type III secretory pathway protein FliN
MPWWRRLEVVPSALVAGLDRGDHYRLEALARAALDGTGGVADGPARLHSLDLTDEMQWRAPLRVHAPVAILEGPEPMLEIWIELDPRDARDGIARALGATDLPAGPFTELELAALEPGLTSALSTTAPTWTLAELAPSLRSLSTAPPVDRIVSTWERGGRWLRAHAPPSTAAGLPDRVRRPWIPPWCPPIDVSVELTGLTATPEDLRALAPGDVLLGLSPIARVHLGSRRHPAFSAEFHPPAPTSTTRAHLALRLVAHGEGAPAMTDEADAPPTPAPASPRPPAPDAEPTLLHRAPTTSSDEALTILEEVALEVEVELCRVSVPVAAVLDWVPGHVIDLACEPSSPVVLRVGGTMLGRGHLIEIEGRLGVRLVELRRSAP